MLSDAGPDVPAARGATQTRPPPRHHAATRAHRRRDARPHLAKAIASTRGIRAVAVEDLSLRNMLRSAKGTRQQPGSYARAKTGLNRSLSRAGLAELHSFIEQACLRRGVAFQRVPAAGTSLTCHGCGAPGDPRDPSGLLMPGVRPEVQRGPQRRTQHPCAGVSATRGGSAARSVVVSRWGPRPASPARTSTGRPVMTGTTVCKPPPGRTPRESLHAGDCVGCRGRRMGVVETEESRPLRVKVIYSLSSLPSQVLSQAFALWIIFFYAPPSDEERGAFLPTLGLPALDLGFFSLPDELSPRVLLGLALTLMRILDSIDDPLIGYLTDRTSSRWGRRIPYIVLASPWWALLFVALFLPPFAGESAGNILWLIVVVEGYWLASNFSGAPLEALLPHIARSHQDRVTVGALQLIFGWPAPSSG